MFSNISHDLVYVRHGMDTNEMGGNSLLRVGDTELFDLEYVRHCTNGQLALRLTLVNSWTRKMPQTSFPCWKRSVWVYTERQTG